MASSRRGRSASPEAARRSGRGSDHSAKWASPAAPSISLGRMARSGHGPTSSFRGLDLVIGLPRRRFSGTTAAATPPTSSPPWLSLGRTATAARDEPPTTLGCRRCPLSEASASSATASCCTRVDAGRCPVPPVLEAPLASGLLFGGRPRRRHVLDSPCAIAVAAWSLRPISSNVNCLGSVGRSVVAAFRRRCEAPLTTAVSPCSLSSGPLS